MLATPVAAQSTIALSLGQEQGCRQLFMPDCKGQRERLEARVTREDGTYTTYGYEQFTEAANHRFVDWQKSALANRVRLGAQANWQLQFSGQRLTWQRGYQIMPNFTAEFGAYLGKLDGNAGLSAQAVAQQDVLHFPLPANPTGLTSITIPAHSTSITHQDARSGSSPYGGLTQAAQYRIPLSTNWQIHVQQQLQAGADQAYVSLGALLRFQDPHWQTAIGVSAQKIFFDPLYDKIEVKAEQLAGKINTHLQPLSSRLEGTPYALTPVTQSTVLRALDIDSPYKGYHPRLHIEVGTQLGGAKLRLQHSRPLKSSPSVTPRTSLTASYTF